MYLIYFKPFIIVSCSYTMENNLSLPQAYNAIFKVKHGIFCIYELRKDHELCGREKHSRKGIES